jgi:hypothetical protein
VNLVSRSLTIQRGSPNWLTMKSKKSLATSSAVTSSRVGISLTRFDKESTIVSTDILPFEVVAIE